MRISEFRQIVWAARERDATTTRVTVKLQRFRDAWAAHNHETVNADEGRELLKRDKFMTLVEKDTWLIEWGKLVSVGSQWESLRLGIYEVTKNRGRLIILAAVQPLLPQHPVLRVDLPGLLTGFDPYVKSAWERLGTVI